VERVSAVIGRFGVVVHIADGCCYSRGRAQSATL